MQDKDRKDPSVYFLCLRLCMRGIVRVSEQMHFNACNLMLFGLCVCVFVSFDVGSGCISVNTLVSRRHEEGVA